MTRRLLATPERRLLAIALVVRLVPAWLIFGTEDVSSWQDWGRALVEGGNPYQTKALIAWPPLWLPFVANAYRLASVTGLPFSFLAKLGPILADVIIVFILYAAAAAHGRRPYATALAYALNPLAIYVSAIGGNFDAIPTLCLTIATVVAARAAQNAPRSTAFWLGVGAAFKTWPLLILPALVTRMTFRQRAVVTAGATAIFLAALLLTWPLGGWKGVVDVLLYRGSPGWWGISSIVGLCGGDAYAAARYRNIFYVAMIAVALFLLVLRAPIARGAVLLLLTFYVAASTYGPQYLVWIVPVALLADRIGALAYTAVGSALMTWETLARPYTSHLGDVVRLVPHPGFAAAYGGPADYRYTVMLRVVLWLFFCGWWLTTAIAIVRARRVS